MNAITTKDRNVIRERFETMRDTYARRGVAVTVRDAVDLIGNLHARMLISDDAIDHADGIATVLIASIRGRDRVIPS